MHENSAIKSLTLQYMRDLLGGFAGLFYPPLCHACRAVLFHAEKYFCTHCRLSLPQTGFEVHKDNQLSRIFWGRMPVETGTALYYFDKGDKVQKLIHRFKYQGDIALGFHLAFLLGQKIRRSPLYRDIDLVVPVPLHPAKERKRGFNQSAVIAGGIARALGLSSAAILLVRRHESSTQTRKSRYRRWENVSEAFVTPVPHRLEDKGVLLVDDVITTGSTLEACGQQLLKVKGLRLWIACLAITA